MQVIYWGVKTTPSVWYVPTYGEDYMVSPGNMGGFRKGGSEHFWDLKYL